MGAGCLIKPKSKWCSAGSLEEALGESASVSSSMGCIAGQLNAVQDWLLFLTAVRPHCHAVQLLRICICFSFLSACYDRSSLKKEGVVYAHTLRVQSVPRPGKVLWQECEAAGHMACMDRKQGEC